MPAQIETERRLPPKRDLTIHYGEPKDIHAYGVDPGVDKLNLAADVITSIRTVDKKTGIQRFLFLPNHFFAGEHLEQFLEIISPHGKMVSGGVRGDVEMPSISRRHAARGLREEEYGDIRMRLHRIHMEDPEIGSFYKEFLDERADRRILRALVERSSNSVFRQLQDLVFINDVEEYVRNFSQEVDMAFESMDRGKILAVVKTATGSYSFSSDSPFIKFLGKYPEFKDDAYYSIPGIFGGFSIERQVSILKDFFAEMSEEERREFALRQGNKLIVDIDSHSIVRGESFLDLFHIRARFTEGNTFEISNSAGARVLVIPDQNIDFGQIDWKMSNYHVTPDYFENALCPVIAVEEDLPGNRRFIKQSEVKKLLKKVFKNSGYVDARLGVAWAAYFSPGVTRSWPSIMALGQGRRLQEMMGAQMLVWPQLATEKYPHATQLLNSSDSVISVLIDDLKKKAA